MHAYIYIYSGPIYTLESATNSHTTAMFASLYTFTFTHTHTHMYNVYVHWYMSYMWVLAIVCGMYSGIYISPFLHSMFLSFHMCLSMHAYGASYCMNKRNTLSEWEMVDDGER